MRYGYDGFMKGHRAIELSHELFPSREEYRLEVENRYVEELLPGYRRPDGVWYVMSEVAMWSHVGTHLESPFHYFKDREDVAHIPLTRVIGEAVLIDFCDKINGESISAAELAERGRAIQPGDIVFIRTGLSIHYRTEQSHDRPYFTIDAIQWLVDKEIACLGVDCSGIEKRDEASQPDHALLFSHGIPLIEHLTHLDQLTRDRFFVVAVPWRVHGLEASPVSVIAFEKEDPHEPG